MTLPQTRAAAASTIRSSTPSATRRWCACTRMAEGSRRQGRHSAQARILQSALQRQGPHRRGHDRGAGESRASSRPAKSTARRADQRQYRHRAGLRRRRQGLQADPGDAGNHVGGTAQDAADPGRRDRADRRRQGHAAAPSPRAQELVADHPGRGDPAAIRKSRQSRNPSPHHGRGNLERHRRQGGHRDLRRGHRRHHHRRRPGAEGEKTVGAR